MDTRTSVSLGLCVCVCMCVLCAVCVFACARALYFMLRCVFNTHTDENTHASEHEIERPYGMHSTQTDVCFSARAPAARSGVSGLM